MRFLALAFLLPILAGCVVAQPAQTVPARIAPPVPVGAAASFGQVAARVEQVAERECRARAPRSNCDFVIVVESDPRAGVNAFQTLDRTGRPVIIVTTGLIDETRNADEIAFVMGHEAAHHIEQHIPQQRQSARQGALVFGVLAQISGADQTGIQQAVELGAVVGARRFSQEHELEADALGTVIAYFAGFDPLRGAEFFNRLPDPGDRFLGTHPPNAARQDMVRRTMASLRAAG